MPKCNCPDRLKILRYFDSSESIHVEGTKIVARFEGDNDLATTEYVFMCEICDTTWYPSETGYEPWIKELIQKLDLPVVEDPES